MELDWNLSLLKLTILFFLWFLDFKSLFKLLKFIYENFLILNKIVISRESETCCQKTCYKCKCIVVNDKIICEIRTSRCRKVIHHGNFVSDAWHAWTTFVFINLSVRGKIGGLENFWKVEKFESIKTRRNQIVEQFPLINRHSFANEAQNGK